MPTGLRKISIYKLHHGDAFVFAKYAIKLCHLILIDNAIHSTDHVFIDAFLKS